MRRFSLLVLAITFLLPAAAAAQGNPDTPTLGFSVGYWGPFSSEWNGGFTARFNAELPYQGPLGFRFTAGVADLSRGPSHSRRSADLLSVTAGAIYQLPTHGMNTFVHGGVGVARITGGGSSTELGVCAGAGVVLPLALKGASLVPELTAHAVTGKGPGMSITLTMGMRFDVR